MGGWIAAVPIGSWKCFFDLSSVGSVELKSQRLTEAEATDAED